MLLTGFYPIRRLELHMMHNYVAKKIFSLR